MTTAFVQVWPKPTASLRERVQARVAADELAGTEYPPLSNHQAARLTFLMSTPANQRAGR
jgi:hypothetical protein